MSTKVLFLLFRQSDGQQSHHHQDAFDGRTEVHTLANSKYIRTCETVTRPKTCTIPLVWQTFWTFVHSRLQSPCQ